MSAGWCSRTVRAAVFAAVCVLFAALGHVMMSGTPVPWWTLTAGLGATGAVGWCLAGRERGLPLIVTVVVAVQTALHTGFSVGQSEAGTAATGMGAMSSTSMGAMRMDPMHPMHSMTSMDAMDMGHGGTTGSESLGMLAAHLLAALLCGLWLACGERAAFRILRAVAGWPAAPLRLVLALPAPPYRPIPGLRRSRSAHRAPRRLLLVHTIISRGPPLGTAVA